MGPPGHHPERPPAHVPGAGGRLPAHRKRAKEANRLPGPTDSAIDFSGTITPDSGYGPLPEGVFGFEPDPTVRQVTVWPLYLVPTLAPFPSPVGFASGKGKVNAPDDQGTQPDGRPSTAPQA